jgi:hypothetical protein
MKKEGAGMKFMVRMTNELPFMLEIPNGVYHIGTSAENISLTVNSDYYKLHTARFPQFAGKHLYYGSKGELSSSIQNSDMANYAFGECKTFISCSFNSETDFAEDDYASVSSENCISAISSEMIRKEMAYTDSNDLRVKAECCFSSMEPSSIMQVKEGILVFRELNKLAKYRLYYEALNQLIRQYSFLRKHFWVYKVNENILTGTVTQQFLNGRLIETTTFGGLVPSISPYTKIFPEITDEEKSVLEDRLTNRFTIPIEEDLILVARSLWYRMEYRSAIIESSAALEIMVEKKLIEKMKLRGMSEGEIEAELVKTETNFTQRCDVFLKRYTGKSFVNDNPTLWNTIDQNRKNYRHRIAHSDVNPDEHTTQAIISDFEKAIHYISSL